MVAPWAKGFALGEQAVTTATNNAIKVSKCRDLMLIVVAGGLLTANYQNL
jgi:hypothetical protein